MMKKVKGLTIGMLAICTVIVMVASMAFAQETHSGSLLSVLGVMEEIQDPDVLMTRAEAASGILRLSGVDKELARDVAQGYNVFEDVTADSIWIWDINAAYQLGYLNGTSASTFAPEEDITYAQILKMTLSVLGYDYLAEQYGGFPSGYLVVANDIGLTKNITVPESDFVTKGTAAEIFINALTLDMMEPMMPYNDRYEVAEDKNLLTSVFKLTKRTGVVTATSHMRLAKDSPELKEGYVVIDGTKFAEGSSNASQYAGYTVEYYVNENDPETLLFAVPKKNLITVIEADNINTVKAGNGSVAISYLEEPDSAKELEEVLSFSTTSLIYNGIYSDPAKDTEIVFNPTDGRITLLDNDSDGTYEYAFVDSYKTVVVKSYSHNDKTIEFFYDVDVDADGNYDKYLVVDPDKIELTLEGDYAIEDLKKGDILSVYQSRDDVIAQKYMRIIRSNEVASGVVTEVNSGPQMSYVFEGMEYKLTDDLIRYLEGIQAKLPLGSECTLYLNAEGKVAFLDNYYYENRLYGFLTDAALTKGIDESAQFRVFTQNGEFRTFTLTEQVDVIKNGVKEGKQNARDLATSFMTDEKTAILYDSSAALNEAYKECLDNTHPGDYTGHFTAEDLGAYSLTGNLGCHREPTLSANYGIGAADYNATTQTNGEFIIEIRPDSGGTFSSDSDITLEYSYRAMAFMAYHQVKVSLTTDAEPAADGNWTVLGDYVGVNDFTKASHSIGELIGGSNVAYIRFELATANTWGFVSDIVVKERYNSGNYIFEPEKMQLIRFRPDSEGKIDLIEFADQEPADENERLMKAENNDFTLGHAKKPVYFYLHSRMVHDMAAPGQPYQYAVLPSTIIFNVPADPALNPDAMQDEEAYTIGAFPTDVEGRNYTLASYNEDALHGSRVIVNYSGSTPDAYNVDTPFTIVEKVVTAVDENGEEYIKLTGWSDGQLRTYKCEADKNVFVRPSLLEPDKNVPLRKGDIINIANTLKGNVTSIRTVFCRTEKSDNGFGYTYTDPVKHVVNWEYNLPAYGAEVGSYLTQADGRVVDKNDRYMLLESPDGSKTMLCYIGEGFNLATVSIGTETITTGGSRDSIHVGDYVVLRQHSGQTREIVRYIY